MNLARCAATALTFGCMLLPLASQAHKPSDAYLQLRVDGTHVEQRFDIALRDLDREMALDSNDDGQLDWREVRTRWPEIEKLSQSALVVTADGKPCIAGPSGTPQLEEHSDGRYAVLTRPWSCPAAVHQLDVGYALFAQSDPTHRGIVRVQHGTQVEPAALVPGALTHRFIIDSEKAASPGLIGFVLEGMHHILIGTDHVLFLLALLLPAVLVRVAPPLKWQPASGLKPVLMDVLRVVTAFTVAHSITLALAAFDVVNPPSRWVESIIAASVVLAALNNLFPVVREGRWKLTFGFGLVHGFGFAGALKDIGLARSGLAMPLFGFNVGVELGQLAIVALFVSLVWRLRSTRLYRRTLLPVGSIAIALLALSWLIERAFDIKLPLPF